MNFVDQLSAVALLVDFFLGVTFGVIGGAVHGSVREDKKKSLLRAPPHPMSGGARMIFGIYTRDDDGYMASLLSGSGRVSGIAPDKRGSDGSNAERKDPRL